MTVILVHNIKRYVGTSLDTKPTLANSDAGSMFHETDTNAFYIWTGSIWTGYVEVEIPPYPEMPEVPVVDVGGDPDEGGMTSILTTNIAMGELFEEMLAELKKVNTHLQSITDEEITEVI